LEPAHRRSAGRRPAVARGRRDPGRGNRQPGLQPRPVAVGRAGRAGRALSVGAGRPLAGGGHPQRRPRAGTGRPRRADAGQASRRPGRAGRRYERTPGVPGPRREPLLALGGPPMTVAGASEQPREGALAHVAKFGRMVKFEHTLFALPFALASAAIAARGHGISGARIAGIVLAMAGARTAAMGFNRIVDRQIDARNPRTARREIPAGVISLRAAWTMTLAATALFVLAAAALGPLCLALSPVALLLLFGYSFTKRFTALCHLFLGLAIAAGPAGAWIAVRGDFGWPPGL